MGPNWTGKLQIIQIYKVIPFKNYVQTKELDILAKIHQS